MELSDKIVLSLPCKAGICERYKVDGVRDRPQDGI